MDVRSQLHQRQTLPEGGKIKVIPFGIMAEYAGLDKFNALKRARELVQFYGGDVKLSAGPLLVSWQKPAYTCILQVVPTGHNTFRVQIARVDRH